MEKEINNSLPFLDVLNIKSDSSLKRNIFKKPIKIDCIISFADPTSWIYKMYAFNSFIKRAHIVCSEEFSKDELDHLIDIDHGCNLKVIHN